MKHLILRFMYWRLSVWHRRIDRLERRPWWVWIDAPGHPLVHNYGAAAQCKMDAARNPW